MFSAVQWISFLLFLQFEQEKFIKNKILTFWAFHRGLKYIQDQPLISAM
jgi:hypothetical protein